MTSPIPKLRTSVLRCYVCQRHRFLHSLNRNPLQRQRGFPIVDVKTSRSRLLKSVIQSAISDRGLGTEKAKGSNPLLARLPVYVNHRDASATGRNLSSSPNANRSGTNVVSNQKTHGSSVSPICEPDSQQTCISESIKQVRPANVRKTQKFICQTRADQTAKRPEPCEQHGKLVGPYGV